MRGPKPKPIELTPNERVVLEKVARAQKLAYQSVLRAKLILLAAQGLRNAEIARRLRTQVKTVRKWRDRFLKERLKGLKDLFRLGAPSAFSP